MVTLEDLKKQHTELLEIVDVLAVLIHTPSVCHTTLVDELYQRLIERVEAHLNDQDKTFSAYLTHNDSTIRKDIERFLSGSKIVHNIFNKYRRQWRLHYERCAKQDAFAKDSDEFFTFMKKRLHDEEDDREALFGKLKG